VSAGSNGFGRGGSLKIAATESATLTQDSAVQSSSSLSGAGGSISVNTPRLALDRSSITTAAYGSGNAGNIDISVGHLDITSGFISSDASLTASGAAGNVTVSATEDVSMQNSGTALDRPRISSSTFGDGNAGSITINTKKFTLNDALLDTHTLGGKGSAGTIKVNVNQLLMQNGGSLGSDVGDYASGKGGSIEVTASDSIRIEGVSPTLAGFNSGISTGTLGSGPAGQISVKTPKLSIDLGTITATTAIGTGDAGAITIDAGEISLTHQGNIQVATLGAGKGGNLRISADSITIDGSGQGIFRTGISTQAQGSGAGGDVHLTARDLQISNGGIVSGKSTGTGRAGTLTFDINGTLDLINSSIVTNAELSAGGNIDMHVGERVFLQNSTITSSANGVTATDNGGNVTISRPQFLVINSGSILARANAGNGGNITLAADFFVQSADSIISASSKRGLDGKIVIDSPHQVTGTVNFIEVPPLDISELLRERCAAAAFEEKSSFTVEGPSGLPLRPGDFLSSPLMQAPPSPAAPTGTFKAMPLGRHLSRCTGSPRSHKTNAYESQTTNLR